jgi:spermidine/putrescine-binding protein
MQTWWPRILIAGALGVIVGLPLVWGPSEEHTAGARSTLVIITPHNEQIRHEVGRAFQQWHLDRYGESVDLDWRAIGGSSDVLRILSNQYQALARKGQEDKGAGYDLVFGGGDYLFDRQLKRVPITTPDGKNQTIAVTQPIAFDPAFVKEVYPDQKLAGRPLYDPEGHWWGVVLTSFGIVYNRDALAMLDLPDPRTWHDMADPKLAGWVALVDPSHSGSIRVTYEAIVQRYGWDDGWGALRRAAANARYFASSSSQVPIDVAEGQAAMGMSIDFYGRYQSQVIGKQRVDYVANLAETVVNADPIAVLRGAPNRAVAERFVKFLLTTPGQVLWELPAGHELGPETYELRRSPIRRDVYTDYGQQFVDKDNPFDAAKPLPEGTPTYFDVIPMILHAMAIDTHEELQRAWQAINEEQDAARKAEMLALFDAMPFTPEQLDEARQRWKQGADEEQDRLAWTKAFRGNYRRIVAMGK